MARITEIVIDSMDPAGLASFWANVLDDYKVRPYDDEELARLGGSGLTPETDPSVAVDGPDLTLFFQKTELPKSSRNRIHFDIRSENRIEEVKRLEALGARMRDIHDTFTVMLDPESNEFCVVDSK